MAKGLTIEATNLSKVIANLKAKGAEKRKVVASKLQKTAFNIVADAQTAAPVDMGNLRRSIRVTQVTESDATIESGANYSAYVEFGTGGLVDVPQGLEAYAMTFKGKGVKQINLPARPFFFPAVRKHEKILIEELKIELNK